LKVATTIPTRGAWSTGASRSAGQAVRRMSGAVGIVISRRKKPLAPSIRSPVSGDRDRLASYAQWVLAPSLPEFPTQPTSSYFLCGTPRGGTWLLAGLLDSTGVAGHPHEYFWWDTEEANQARWGVSSFSDYLRHVKEVGTTENGVFGAKLMWGYMAHFLDKLRNLSDEQVVGDRALVERFFPKPRFVLVWREDVAAQAVSWAKALQTGRWHHWDSPSTEVEPRFDSDQIDALAHEATTDDAAWRRWFAENRIDAFQVRHEDLVEDMDGVTRRVLAFLEIAPPPGSAVTAQTVKAGNAQNREWVARYLGLRA
jgi:LPS sulfotransferase NodH